MDKEFRYLRIVRVTTAVYRTISLKLHIYKNNSPFPFSFRHRAGVRPYTAFYNFAKSCVFVKQLLPPISCHPNRQRRSRVPLLPKLRGHFAEFLKNGSFDHLCRFLLLHQWRFPVRYKLFWLFPVHLISTPFSPTKEDRIFYESFRILSHRHTLSGLFILGAVLLYADSQCVENLEVSVIMYFTWFYVTHISIVTCEIFLIFSRI